jgi:predicted ArsR family transcriptional regulator
MLLPISKSQRHKALTVLAHEVGFSASDVANHLAISRNSVRRCLSAFKNGAIEALFATTKRARMQDDESLRQAVFSLLHERKFSS